MITGRHAGAAVIIENDMGVKIPTLVCHHHYVKLLKSAAQRDAFGPTKAPEEGYAKRVKTWWNKNKKKDSFLSQVRFLFVICDE